MKRRIKCYKAQLRKKHGAIIYILLYRFPLPSLQLFCCFVLDHSLCCYFVLGGHPLLALQLFYYLILGYSLCLGLILSLFYYLILYSICYFFLCPFWCLIWYPLYYLVLYSLCHLLFILRLSNPAFLLSILVLESPLICCFVICSVKLWLILHL